MLVREGGDKSRIIARFGKKNSFQIKNKHSIIKNK